MKPPGVPRTAEEKLRTRDEANRKLSSLVPGMFSHRILILCFDAGVVLEEFLQSFKIDVSINILLTLSWTR